MTKDSVQLCPKCGSTKWKFANPLKGTPSMINIPSMVNNLCECTKCGYIGIFFEVDKDKVKEVQKDFKK
ncbi:hypothetical protein ISS05_05395 [Candidatus Woesearchaeota archaeon]|nr:hypothetical protein [Candidatus Woesearchaeota archaeon]